MKKIIKVKKTDNFLFCNKKDTWAIVVTMESIIENGVPIVPADHPGEGDNAEYVGQVDIDIPEGEVNLEKFELPL